MKYKPLKSINQITEKRLLTMLNTSFNPLKQLKRSDYNESHLILEVNPIITISLKTKKHTLNQKTQ